MNHKQSLLFVLLTGILSVLGCSGATQTTISPTPTSNVRYVPADNTVVLAGIRTVAIFPFADYSHQQNHLDTEEWGGNIKIVEEVTDQFTAHGITVVVQEDVNTMLVDEKVIRPIDKDKFLIYGTTDQTDENYKKISTPEYEVANVKHSPDMADEIKKIVDLSGKNKKNLSATPVLQGATVGLTKEKITELGSRLGVDIIVRGRILNYGYKNIGTVNPLYRGFIPVVIDSVKDMMYGATNAYGYENDLENVENMAVGGSLGYAVGEKIQNGATYGAPGLAIGAASGWMASQHPKKAKRMAVVQVRLYAQNATNGEVLWTNRAEIEYTPKSNFAYNETHPKTMFDNAVKSGIKQLMDDFFKEAAEYSTKAPVEEPAAPITDVKPGV